MKKTAKMCVSAVLVVILAVLIVIRIVYVNTVSYSISVREVYNIDEEFEYNGMLMKLSEYKVYSGEELDSLYDDELTDIVDGYDILFNLTITNISDENTQFNVSGSGMMYGYESGGNVNPYLFQYFNPNTRGIIELVPSETKTVTLAFPIEFDTKEIEYIVSLYPENVRVKMK